MCRCCTSASTACRTYASDRLSRVLLEGGGTPQARSERESFTQMYTEDLARYDAAENGLCFGRIDVDGEPRYVGRVGILDEDGDYETLLLDWRAPLARPFYLATPAAPGGSPAGATSAPGGGRSRRSTTSTSTSTQRGLTATAAERAVSAGESALSGRTERGPDRADARHRRNHPERAGRIIRSNHRSVLVVQEDLARARPPWPCTAPPICSTRTGSTGPAGVLIIGPNATFLDYIGQVLPSLV